MRRKNFASWVASENPSFSAKASNETSVCASCRFASSSTRAGNLPGVGFAAVMFVVEVLALLAVRRAA